MDADFSHDPRYIPDLIAAAERGADVVLGSRFVAGGADADRGLHRQVITKLAGAYVRAVLGIRARDVSSGYRCFRRRALEAIDLSRLISTGPSIVLEILFKCIIKGMTITEVPIVFVDRVRGETKLNFRILIKTLLMVLKFRELKSRGAL
jgi:dolichol-phosphate mannosyltransferase